MKPPSTEHVYDYYDTRMVDEIIRRLMPNGLNREAIDRERHQVHSFIDEVVKLDSYACNLKLDIYFLYFSAQS